MTGCSQLGWPILMLVGIDGFRWKPDVWVNAEVKDFTAKIDT